MIGVTVFLVVTIFVFIFCRAKKSKKPPGPPSLPILGSLPFINYKQGLFGWTLDEAVTRHKLATVRLGPKAIYVINDLELAKELFSKEEFSGRGVPQFHLAHRFFNGKAQGIINTEGQHWVTQRRFSLKTLKDFGFGKQSLEEAINQEVEKVISQLLSNDEDALLSTDFNIPMINILWQMVAGKRFTEDDLEGMNVVASVNNQFKIGKFLTLIPLAILKRFPNLADYKEKVNIYDIQKKYIVKEIEKHEETLDPKNPRDFIDAYLNEISRDNEEKDFNKEDLAICMMDFLHAGTETSSTTMKWLILYLTLHQEVQTKCRTEIHEALGSSPCRVEDMMRLPYVQATIAEVQRVSRVAPVSLAHKTTARTTALEYSFPPGSAFFANLSFIMNDEEHFVKPQVFDPERHIGQEGKFIKNERIIPYGIGKRYCMGELLARNEIFLFTVNLLQKMKFLPPSSHPLPDHTQFSSVLTTIPQDFWVKFVHNL